MARTSTSRRGAILLIVLVLLALFAVVGLAFVLFSQAEAQNARIMKEGMTGGAEAPDPQAPLNEILRQVLYGTTDSGTAVTSSLRGHNLAMLMYGNHPNAASNTVPYSGIGTFSETIGTIGNRLSIVNFAGINSGDTVLDPEYTGSRLASAVYSGGVSTGVFIPKNAPYTYPDRNNMAVAMMNPASGKVVTPSFHRNDLFNFNLGAANPDWNSITGRYKLLRPRPADHMFDSGDGRGLVSDFPYPPPNPDGTITGDLQNMRFANDVQQNDAVWIHANLPRVKHRGRELQPLVAMTILPLDGRVNFNVAGNHRDSGNGHASNQGFGPYEIDPQKVMVPPGSTTPSTPANEAQELIRWRYGSTYRPSSAPWATAVNSNLFDPTIPNGAFADYSPVNWDAFNAPYPVPTSNSGLRTEPYYSVIQGYDNNLTSPNHQALFNPYFLNDVSASGGRTLRLFDLRQTAYRYSGRKSNYAPPLFGFSQPDSSFTGVGPRHPSNRTRALGTTISNSVQRPGLMANFPVSANYALLATNPLVAPSPAGTPMQFNAVAPAANSDTVPGQGYRSLAAALGPVDLNRPIADYRSNKMVPLENAANLGTMSAFSTSADRDRQIFAKDIFDRLVIATGAACDGFNVQTGRPIGFASVPPGTPQYNALRYLAQVAANIVDFVDIDDVNTRFVWNPANPANPMPEADAANFNPADMGNRVVFGVEKTRLVINEVYSEVTNDPGDATAPAANSDFQVRFFVELLNPLNANRNHYGPNATNTSPFGACNASFRIGTHSVYRVQIYDDGNAMRPQLFDHANPTGMSNVTGTPTSPARLSVQMPNGASAVEPNDNISSNTGFRHLCTQPAVSHSASDTAVYRPTANARLVQIPVGGGTNQLHYTVPKQRPNDIPTNTMTQLNTIGATPTGKHAVLLQRLANPYLPTGPTNPYITVDSMFDVYVNDAIRVGENKNPAPLPPDGSRTSPPNPTTNAGKSHGRRAPLYGYRGSTAQASYAIDQQRTMLSHNNNKFPIFEWLTHHDRKLINTLEVLQVAGCRPHELLHYFVTSNNGQMDVAVQPSQKHHHTVPWQQSTTNMARGLEMLSVKPWMYGIPLGGRQPGRMNVNAIWHADAASALLDPRTGNRFNAGDVNTLWTSLLGSNGTPGFAGRTRNYPDTTSTSDEGNPNGDKPIKSFGVANFTAGGSIPLGTSVNDSLFRTNPSTGAPIAFYNASGPTAVHPMAQAEMLRKASNNITTTTDTYLMVFTIGYFEIRAVGPQPTAPNTTRIQGMPILGREAYNEIPGDLRVQYAAILDRSMMAIHPDPLSPFAGQQAPNVFMTELAETFDPATSTTIRFHCTGGNNTYLKMDYEGREIRIRTQTATLAANEVDTLVLGTGRDAVYIRIPAGAALSHIANSGIGTITFPAGYFTGNARIPLTSTVATSPLRKFYAGESVSSVILGNPGPQAFFDPNSAQFKQVVRDLIKLTP